MPKLAIDGSKFDYQAIYVQAGCAEVALSIKFSTTIP